MDLPRSLTYVPLEQIRPALSNPRAHDRAGIIASITRFGLGPAMMVDERTGRLILGHGRLEALVEMRTNGYPNPKYSPAWAGIEPELLWEAPEGVVLDDDGGWLVPMQRGWRSRTDAEAAAMVVADNKLTENATWHNVGLAELMEQVVTEDASLLDAVGMSGDELDALLRTVSVERLTDPDPDATVLPDATDPKDGAQSIDVPPAIGQDADRALGDDDEGTSYEEDRTTCPACAHSWVRDADRLTVLGADEPTSIGNILRYGSGLLLSGGLTASGQP